MIIAAPTLDVQLQPPVHTKMNLPVPGWRQTECTEYAGGAKNAGINLAPNLPSIPSTYLKSLALTYEMVVTGSVILQLTISRRTSTTGQGDSRITGSQPVFLQVWSRANHTIPVGPVINSYRVKVSYQIISVTIYFVVLS